MGAAGAQAAAVLTRAGLRVVGLEAGPWRSKHDFVPDELGSAYYCRGAMGPKFLAEVPRWRAREDAEDGPATFTLGRMMNGVGGSVIHWGGALRRCHPHHFAYRCYVRDAFGDDVLPEGHTLADWPVGYDELEPYYCDVEHQIGVAGDESNPWVRRSRPLPLPPTRPFTMGERFREAATRLGLHPYPDAGRRQHASPTTASPRLATAPGAAASARSTTSAGTPGSPGSRRRWRPATSTCARTAACCGCWPDATAT